MKNRALKPELFLFSLFRYLFPLLVMVVVGLLLLLFILPASNIPA